MMIKRTKTKICLLASAFGVLVLSGPAVLQAQSSDPAGAAAAEIRFQQLEKEIRRLTGQIEEQNYEIRRLKNEIDKVTGNLDVRVRDLEAVRHSSFSNGGGAPVSTGTAYTSRPVSSGGAPSADDNQNQGSFQYTPPRDEHDEAQYNAQAPATLGTLNKSPETGAVSSSDNAAQDYEYAYSFINARNFDRAEAEFAKFIREHPNDALVSNAKYWYGETFYVRGNYEKAARIFAEGYQQYPKGPKAASNLLKLGMALSGMGKTDDACIAYKQLKKEYSGSSVPLLKRASMEMKKIKCR